jgi:hypothetical protein
MTHVGSGCSEVEVALLVAEADRLIHAGQDSLFPGEGGSTVEVVRTFSSVLWDALEQLWVQLGFGLLDDEVFRRLVLARVVEPTSKLDSIRVLEDLGVCSGSVSGIYRSLRRCQEQDYRGLLQRACFAHVGSNGLGLLLYDVTTLYFEVHQEDDYRIPGYSKERRLEPQIIVGLLVNVDGFPLAVQSFEGNKAETLTILPVVEAFVSDHDLSGVTIVADAGMLSETNLGVLEDAGFKFIVGSRVKKTPYSISEYTTSVGKPVTDGQVFVENWTQGTLTKPRDWNVVYQYRQKRASLDLRNIDKQIAKALQVSEGTRPVSTNRFVSIRGGQPSINTTLVEQARLRAGIKGYITNLDLNITDPQQIITAYHQLFEVETSFRNE